MKIIYRFIGTDEIIFTSRTLQKNLTDFDLDRLYPGYRVWIFGADSIDEMVKYYRNEYGIPFNKIEWFRETLQDSVSQNKEVLIKFKGWEDFSVHEYKGNQIKE